MVIGMLAVDGWAQLNSTQVDPVQRATKASCYILYSEEEPGWLRTRPVPPLCTKCNGAPINDHCTNYDVAL